MNRTHKLAIIPTRSLLFQKTSGLDQGYKPYPIFYDSMSHHTSTFHSTCIRNSPIFVDCLTPDQYPHPQHNESLVPSDSIREVIYKTPEDRWPEAIRFLSKRLLPHELPLSDPAVISLRNIVHQSLSETSLDSIDMDTITYLLRLGWL